MSSFLIGTAGNNGERALLSASHTTRAYKTPFGVGFQEWHANIRLSTDHLEDISLGGPTVVTIPFQF